MERKQVAEKKRSSVVWCFVVWCGVCGCVSKLRYQRKYFRISPSPVYSLATTCPSPLRLPFPSTVARARKGTCSSPVYSRRVDYKIDAQYFRIECSHGYNLGDNHSCPCPTLMTWKGSLSEGKKKGKWTCSSPVYSRV